MSILRNAANIASERSSVTKFFLKNCVPCAAALPISAMSQPTLSSPMFPCVKWLAFIQPHQSHSGRFQESANKSSETLPKLSQTRSKIISQANHRRYRNETPNEFGLMTSCAYEAYALVVEVSRRQSRPSQADRLSILLPF